MNNDKCWCECKKRHVCEIDYVWNPTCSCENGNYLANINDSAIVHDKFIESDNEETKTNLTTFNEKKATCQT